VARRDAAGRQRPRAAAAHGVFCAQSFIVSVVVSTAAEPTTCAATWRSVLCMAGNGGVKKLALLWIRWPTGVNVVPKHVNDYYSAQFGTSLCVCF
jgi:hypothetical protein